MARKQSEKSMKKEYMDNPNKCPFCKSDDISAGEFDADTKTGTCTVECSSCGKSWVDIYTLADVDLTQDKE